MTGDEGNSDATKASGSSRRALMLGAAGVAAIVSVRPALAQTAGSGRTLPGTSYEQSQAYVNYIRRLQAGQSGFTCFASLQMPR
jgi:hypothetical protein